MLTRIVLAIDDKGLQSHLRKHFELADVWVEAYGETRTPWQKVIRSGADIVVISDALIPGAIETGIAMLNDLPEAPTTVVLYHGSSSEDHARLLAAGADVVLYAKISQKSMTEAIEKILQTRKQFFEQGGSHTRGRPQPRIGDFLYVSEAMQLFIKEVRPMIASNSPLLILGETGVGKEHLARAIHYESPRSAGPFVTVNAGALPEQLLESELFGHTQGAFTGANRSRRGAFEMAHGGTIFLDEIGEMPLHLQVKLLRVLQDYEVKPVGSENPIWVDVRVVAATNRDLEEEVAEKRFRRDLFYRLSVITLTIPPLRKRSEDIPALTETFLEHYRTRVGRDIESISAEALEALCQYHWPGNVRELMNVIERAMLLSQTQNIEIHDLPHVFHGQQADRSDDWGNLLNPQSWRHKTLKAVMEDAQETIERKYLETVLEATRGRVGKAATIAGIHPRGLYNKMKRLNLKKEQFKTKQ